MSDKQFSSSISTADFFVNPDIKKAETLPATAFTDLGFLSLELDTIFRQTWLLAPISDVGILGEAGAHLPFSLLGKPLFLQHDLNGRLHCFPNVCTHAWHPLVREPGVAKMIVCPQHRRQFGCDGEFISQSGFRNVENFPRESDSLQDLPVERWGQLVFVGLRSLIAPLHDFLKETEESVSRMTVEKFRRTPHRLETREVEGNWKQHAWNYMDNFHIRFIHGGPSGLADIVDLGSYRTELYRFSSLQWAYSRNPEHGFDPSLLPDRFRDPQKPEKRVFALWWFIFPNLALNFYPWGLSVNVYMPMPRRPDRTLFFWYHYVVDEEKYERRNELWLGEQVDAEDIEAIGQVSRGAGSGYAPRGRFAPREEAGPHWFHRLVYEFVFERTGSEGTPFNA